MTVWVLHQKMTKDEENTIAQSTTLGLPFNDFPDFTSVKTQGEYRRLLMTLHPDAPPERISRLLERSWKLHSAIHIEDIIAVPLPFAGEVILAEVIGPPEYHVGDAGTDVHRMPVKWHEKRLSLQKLRKHKALFSGADTGIFEVTSAEVRTLLRDRLPHKYNRFARWKWILALFFAMGLIMRFAHVTK
jgi:predicted Mrr-cat superfamily restriction endonuclease